MFAFVISSAYRSILTASLTLPNIPSRPESVQELVPLIDRATIESYGVSHKKFLTQSESSVFRSLGELMVTGVDAIDGLKESLKNKYAHLGGAQYLELVIAKHFTQIDGSSQVYIGKETIVSSVAAWPIPHDAPYKPFLDRCIKAVTEAGIYEKWRRDTVRQEAIRANQRKFLKLQEQGLEASKDSVTYSNSRKALTLQHMLGLYAIFVIGLVIAGVAFLTEILIRKYSAPSKRCWC
ncbi:ionotropic receptor 93a-like [Homarus americanus]|nr:ionotropic receptor 93a-like [Homarus americanus]